MVMNLKKDDIGYHIDVNNAAVTASNGWVSGIDISQVNGLTISLTAGEVYHNKVQVTVNATDLTLNQGDASYDRFDLIAYDGTGLVALEGVPAATPKPADYDVTQYTILYMVKVLSNSTTINLTDIKDYRVEATIGGAGGRIQTNTFIANFANETNVVVTHNLNDENVIVQVIDTNGEHIIPTTIDNTDANTVTITFDTAQSGTVIIHSGATILTGEISGLSKYVQTFDNVSVIDVTHGLLDLNPTVQVYDNNTNSIIIPDKVEVINSNTIRVTLGENLSGKVVVHGGVPQGSASEGSGLAKYTENFTNITTLVVVHNLNDLTPGVFVYDTNNEAIEPDNITILSNNSLQIDFATQTSGTVTVVGGEYAKASQDIPAAGTKGNLIVDDGNSWIALNIGNDGQVLSVDNGQVSWQTLTIPPTYSIITSAAGTSTSASGNADNTSSVSIDISPNSIENFIIINTIINSSCSANSQYGSEVYTTVRVTKTVAGVEADIYSESKSSHAENYDGGSNGTSVDDSITQLNFIYQPTSDEITSGFTITIYVRAYAYYNTSGTSSGVTSSISTGNIYILGN